MARPRKLTDQQARAVALSYKDGHSAAAIGERFDVSPQTVINCLRAQNVEIRPRGRRAATT